MASDVEVLRNLSDAEAWEPEVLRALTAAISALEAKERRDEARARLSPMPRWDEPIPVAALETREVQPKVDGRMDDAKFARVCGSVGLGYLAVRDEARRARASEAALSERVGHIAQALGVVVDRIDADQYDTKAAIARDIIAALRPLSKPETHQERVHDPARHAWVKPFSDASDLCCQCRRPKSEHQQKKAP